jgi:hypothetical protein
MRFMKPELSQGLEEDLRLAVREIQDGWSAAFARNGLVLGREQGKGLRPALKLVANLERGSACAFADKVLGLAAFRLGCLLGAGVMWGELASELAAAEGRRRGIEVRYHRLVPAIMNLRRDGLCPMEDLAFRSKDDTGFLREVSLVIR